MRYIESAVHFILVLIVPAILPVSVLFAQAPRLAWEKAAGGSLDDEARAVAATPDGGCITAGFTNSTDGDIAALSPHGGYDYLVIKMNASGAVEWMKTYGGSATDKAAAIIPTNDGGYIVAGTSNSNDGDVSKDNHFNANNNQPSNDFWLVKIDDAGTIQWAKSYGGGGDDEPTGIFQTPDNGYIVGGYTNSTDGDISGNHGGYDYWVIRIDGAGNKLWSACYGDKGNDQGFAMARMQDGDYVMTGLSRSNGGEVTGNHGAGDCWVIKIDTGGALKWEISLGGSSLDQGNGIFGTADNGCIVAASTESADGNLASVKMHGGVDGWIIKLDATGAITWSNAYGGSQDDYAEAVIQQIDGSYIAAGQTASVNLPGVPLLGAIDYWLFAIDGTGNVKWQDVYGGSNTDIAYALAPTSDTGWVLAGSTMSDDSEVTGAHLDNGSPTNDCWIMKAGGAQTHTAAVDEFASPTANVSVMIFPNPMEANAIVTYNLTQTGHVDVSIFNLLGEKTGTIVQNVETAGVHSVPLNVSAYKGGVYACRVESSAGVVWKLLNVMNR